MRAAARFSFVSSGGGVCGECEGADEATPPRPKSYYSAHKFLGERYVELSGLSYANARIANVYGSRQRSDLEGGVVAIFIERLQNRQLILINGTGEQRRGLVYVADVVDSLLTMARSNLERVMNLGENLIEMRISRSAWFPRDPCFPHSQAVSSRVHNSL
jgi:UDP-glucose 4-epimerase